MRLELFFKTASELQTLIALVQGANIGAVNLVNKSKTDPLLQYVRTLRSAFPASSSSPPHASSSSLPPSSSSSSPLDIVPHFSIKYQHVGRDTEGAYAHIKSFCTDAASEGVREVLLVSGSGPKKILDPVACLERLSKDKQACSSFLSSLRFGIAFNPYLSEMEDEERRFQAKVATGLVSSVWLQLGSDPTALRKGLDFVRIETEGRSPPIRVIGSVVIPSRKFLAMMKFRPWSGVRLSETYLSSVEEANKATEGILDVYRAYGVEPVVESAVKNEGDLEQVKKLLGDLYGPSPTGSSSSSSSSSKSKSGKAGGGGATLAAAAAGGRREGQLEEQHVKRDRRYVS